MIVNIQTQMKAVVMISVSKKVMHLFLVIDNKHGVGDTA